MEQSEGKCLNCNLLDSSTLQQTAMVYGTLNNHTEGQLTSDDLSTQTLIGTTCPAVEMGPEDCSPIPSTMSDGSHRLLVHLRGIQRL